MKRMNVFVGGILFMMVATSFVGTVGAFGSHAFTINEHALSQSKAEALLTFRIEEEVERVSPSCRAADPRIVSDERKLDPQLPVCDMMKNLVLLNPIECMKTEDIIPINR